MDILYAAGAAAVVLAPVARVLVAWIKSRSSRQVIITTNNTETKHVVKGMSADDVVQVLKAAKRVAVIDTKAPDKTNAKAPAAKV